MTPPAGTCTRIQTGTRRPARLGLMATSLAAVVLLAGCGGSSNKATTGTSTATTAPGATTPAATATVVGVNNARLGAIVADSGGETLYVFDGDTPGKIGCTGSCATLWLPVVLELGQASPTGSGVTASLATVDRAEGPQVTLAGRPLYTYTKDVKPGDTNGDGVGGKWHVAKPAGNPVGATSATTARGHHDYRQRIPLLNPERPRRHRRRGQSGVDGHPKFLQGAAQPSGDRGRQQPDQLRQELARRLATYRPTSARTCRHPSTGPCRAEAQRPGSSRWRHGGADRSSSSPWLPLAAQPGAGPAEPALPPCPIPGGPDARRPPAARSGGRVGRPRVARQWTATWRPATSRSTPPAGRSVVGSTAASSPVSGRPRAAGPAAVDCQNGDDPPHPRTGSPGTPPGSGVARLVRARRCSRVGPIRVHAPNRSPPPPPRRTLAVPRSRRCRRSRPAIEPTPGRPGVR